MWDFTLAEKTYNGIEMCLLLCVATEDNNGYKQCGRMVLIHWLGRVFEHRQIFWIWLWRKKIKTNKKIWLFAWGKPNCVPAPHYS